MEQTFYDDQFRSSEDFRMMKRTMTLDLDSLRPNKRHKVSPLLTSPELNMLKLESPELEKMIIAQNGHVTTTPTPNQYNNMFPKNVTEEQELYARGFVDALAQLHQTTQPSAGSVVLQAVSHDTMCGDMTTAVTGNSLPPCHSVQQCVSMPSDCGVMSSMPSHVSVGYHPSNDYLPQLTAIKEEPQIVPSIGVTPPLSPIDMENQERIKLERKRLRNRIAASKCRKRKLEKIARLEDKVRELKNQNSELGVMASALREQICALKQQVMDHVKNGCQMMMTSASDMGNIRKSAYVV